MNRVIAMVCFMCLVSCSSTALNAKAQYEKGYDRAAENHQREVEVQKELNKRSNAELDSQTRRDLDLAIERNRSK